jgi:hypothetical protein
VFLCLKPQFMARVPLVSPLRFFHRPLVCSVDPCCDLNSSEIIAEDVLQDLASSNCELLG